MRSERRRVGESAFLRTKRGTLLGVCVCERERETARERVREKGREREREKARKRERESGREREHLGVVLADPDPGTNTGTGSC